MLKRKREADLLETAAGKTSNNYNDRGQFYTDADGEAEYTKTKVRVKQRAAMSMEPTTPRSERFSLTGSQRLHMVMVALTAALSYGRASNDLIASTQWGDVASAVVSVATVTSRLTHSTNSHPHLQTQKIVKIKRD